ncbi:MAG TPA: glycosyltransferase [Acidimicrobiia bacterium]
MRASRSVSFASRSNGPHAILVAIPARDEASSIAACVQSVDRSAARLDVPTVVVVAADSCSDSTADVARATAVHAVDLIVSEGQWCRAGAARAAAVSLGLDAIEHPRCRTWIASTDADCVVPEDWLERHSGLAAAWAALAGTVELDPSSTPAPLLAEFRVAYGPATGAHRHVHGANLGVWADAYEHVGGWRTDIAVGEDHALWHELRRAGMAVIHTARTTVVTSSRTRSRVHGGFASDLATLALAHNALQGVSS